MNLDAEWLEPDGRGGFASGTVGGARSRRYHALLLPALRPPVARTVLVNAVEAWLETPGGRFPLSTQRYLGSDGGAEGVLAPRGQDFLVDFRLDPWPRWTFALPDGTRVEHEIFVHHATGLTVLVWRLAHPRPPVTGYKLEMRPLFSGRDYHALHHENPGFAFEPVSLEPSTHGALWRPYAGGPGVRVWSSGKYRPEPAWYRQFLYTEERARGLDCLEDLATPGVFACDLTVEGTGAMLLGLGEEPMSARMTTPPLPPGAHAAKLAWSLRDDEQRRRSVPRAPLRRAGDSYLVRGGRGATILAGYPWFTDWGRDTFISLRGLCLAAGRFEEARDILFPWAGAVSDGMLPNRFPDGGESPEYNSVDAALWFVVAAHDYLNLAPKPDEAAGLERWTREQNALLQTCDAILAGYAAGTRHGVRADEADGLLFAGEPGDTTALTWMDARVDGRPVTARVGKPVEIQALWLNALFLMAANSPRWRVLYEKGHASFAAKFWHEERGCLYDVIDRDGQPGQRDGSLRPNQVFAVGGLPLVLLPPAQARRLVATVEANLLTPTGLRTLAPSDAGYRARYEGGPAQRDAAYHQGTAWPWLLGPFVEAVVRVNGDTKAARTAARVKYVEPLLASLPTNPGLNHLPEITDAEHPYASRGCPFQAWSMGELTRLALGVVG